MDLRISCVLRKRSSLSELNHLRPTARLRTGIPGIRPFFLQCREVLEQGPDARRLSKVFVVEQNRDAQMHALLVNELDINPAQLQRVLHYDGTPITARFIASAIYRHLSHQKESA